jgi:hypothetical protein
MSAMGIATVAAQTPAGAFIDRTRHKRLAIAVGAAAVRRRRSISSPTGRRCGRCLLETSASIWTSGASACRRFPSGRRRGPPGPGGLRLLREK